MFRKSLFASIVTVALAFTLTAADEKKADEKKSTGSKSSGMLQPGMTPEGGWDKAMGTLGEKGEIWSATTVGASVNGKPVSGKNATVTGEIIDLSCYLQLGKHGEKHKSCGQKCLNSGQPSRAPRLGSRSLAQGQSVQSRQSRTRARPLF